MEGKQLHVLLTHGALFCVSMLKICNLINGHTYEKGII